MWKEDEFPCTSLLLENDGDDKPEEDWVVVHHPPKSKPGRTIFPLESASIDWSVLGGNNEGRYITGDHLGLEIDLRESANPKGSIIQDFHRHDAYPLRHSYYTFIKVCPQVFRIRENMLLFDAKREGDVAPNISGDSVTLSFKNSRDTDALENTLSLFKHENDES